MIVLAIILIISAVGNCQRGNYVRPLPEYRIPYRVPVYQELPVSPRMFRPLYYYNTHPEFRSRAQSRSHDLNAVKKDDKIDKTLEPVYPILSYSNQMSQDGAYSYKYETADGVMREETSIMETSEDGKQTPKVIGSYSYPSPDGRMIKVEYIADEGGFRANQISDDTGMNSFRKIGTNGFSYSFRAP